MCLIKILLLVCFTVASVSCVLYRNNYGQDEEDLLKNARSLRRAEKPSESQILLPYSTLCDIFYYKYFYYTWLLLCLVFARSLETPTKKFLKKVLFRRKKRRGKASKNDRKISSNFHNEKSNRMESLKHDHKEGRCKNFITYTAYWSIFFFL